MKIHMLRYAVNSDTWVIDSGASNHMTGDKRLCKTYTMPNVPRRVFTASSSTSLTIIGEGEWYSKYGMEEGTKQSV